MYAVVRDYSLQMLLGRMSVTNDDQGLDIVFGSRIYTQYI